MPRLLPVSLPDRSSLQEAVKWEGWGTSLACKQSNMNIIVGFLARQCMLISPAVLLAGWAHAGKMPTPYSRNLSCSLTPSIAISMGTFPGIYSLVVGMHKDVHCAQLLLTVRSLVSCTYCFNFLQLAGTKHCGSSSARCFSQRTLLKDLA
jgi:hypothetical protein